MYVVGARVDVVIPAALDDVVADAELVALLVTDVVVVLLLLTCRRRAILVVVPIVDVGGIVVSDVLPNSVLACGDVVVGVGVVDVLVVLGGTYLVDNGGATYVLRINEELVKQVKLNCYI
jgi:hypothetical protein